ncbi:MAG TPA: M20/M25/M40 family metallo-hydrolase, partial [Fimbriimonadaceae bacterium]|nr:M20/M25/M40 family metallo-hydrolase [Fimbriimonadaceae bacterium]
MRTSIQRLVAFAILTLVAALSFGQDDPITTQRIIQEGKYRSQVMQLLKELTDIGPRLTSSTNLEKAEQWAVGKFKSWGLSNVHLDKWGEFPVGFDRGKCTGGMTQPTARDFEFTTPSWTEGTHGRKEGEAINAPETMDEFNQVRSRLKGAWIVYKTPPRRQRRVRPGETPPPPTDEEKAAQALSDAIQNAGILGVIYGSNNDLCVTFGAYRDKTFEKHPTDVQIIIRHSDMMAIQEQLDAKKTVKLAFDINQTFRKGPISNYNVVADIPGTEHPDEYVIVSGHLDSWDGPGSQGALDNGTGSCTAMEAARILMASHAKPKRTIRFILWTGEEQGLLGSAGYVKVHPEELPKISAVLVDDGGTDYQGGYIGLESQREFFEKAFAPVVAAFPDMPETYTGGDRQQRPVGSDQDTFNRLGVPGFFTVEKGRSNYGLVHHTQNDRYDMAIPEYLAQSG